MENDRGCRMTVLVVEDINWIRAGMKRILRDYGYRVLEASNATEALKLAESDRPDLILTEEEVPALNALVARLRAHPSLTNIPIAIVNPDKEEGDRCGEINIFPDYESLGRFLANGRERASCN